MVKKLIFKEEDAMANPGPGNQMVKLMDRARTEDDFRKMLLADPEKILRTEGISLPPEVKVKVVENTADLIHIVLPAKEEPLADEALDKVTAGLRVRNPFDKPQKPCGNKTCRLEYNSPDCWVRWIGTATFCEKMTFKS